MQRMSKRVGALVTPVHAVVLSVFVAPATACDSKAFAIVEGRYKPEVTVPNAECYDLVWDFNYGSYAYVEDSTTDRKSVV